MAVWLPIILAAIEALIKWLNNRNNVPITNRKRFNHMLARFEVLKSQALAKGCKVVEDDTVLNETQMMLSGQD